MSYGGPETRLSSRPSRGSLIGSDDDYSDDEDSPQLAEDRGEEPTERGEVPTEKNMSLLDKDGHHDNYGTGTRNSGRHSHRSATSSRRSGLSHHHHGKGKRWWCLGGRRCPSLIPHGGLLGSGFNLASATLGAGTLSLPSAMQGSGVLLGSLILIAVCASTVFSVRLLVVLYERTGYATYEEMAKNFVGPKFEKFTAALIVIFCWGITIVYVVAMGDLLGQLSTLSWFPEWFKDTVGKQVLVIIFWTLFLLPLSLMKEINSLRYTSVIGILSTCFLVVAIVVHEAKSDAPASNMTIAAFDVNMVSALPVFIFSYCCQTNAFEIYSELKPRTVRRMTISAGLSMSVCTIIYIVAGIAGVANYGDSTDGNILKNYNPGEAAYIAVAYLAIAFTLTSAFPICIFPTRDAIVQLMGYENAYVTPNPVRLTLCATLAFLSLVCGLYIPGIRVLFGVLGGVCGSSLGFIFPALFTLRSEGYTRQSAGTLEYVCVWVLFWVGVLAGVLGTVLSIVQQITG